LHDVTKIMEDGVFVHTSQEMRGLSRKEKLINTYDAE
jgi:hypothetical protein